MQTTKRPRSINLLRFGCYLLLALVTLGFAAWMVYLRLFPSQEPDLLRRLNIWAVVHFDVMVVFVLSAVAVAFLAQAHKAHQETLRRIATLQERVDRVADELRTLRDEICGRGFPRAS